MYFNMLKSMVLILFLLSLPFSAFGQSPTPLDKPEEKMILGDLSAEAMKLSEIGEFDFEGDTKRIWESVRNKTLPPTQWQFRYDCLFIPATKSGRLDITNFQTTEGGWKTKLEILLDSHVAGDKAFQVLKGNFGEQAEQIKRDNISARQIIGMIISIPELEKDFPEARLIKKKFDFYQPKSSFIIIIKSPNKETAKAITQELSHYYMDYYISYTSFLSLKNGIEVSMESIRKSKLFAHLDGENKKYIYRNDMRKLFDDIHFYVKGSEYIEDPASFRKSLLNDLTERFFSQVEASNEFFDDNKWAGTYNKDDLKPDRIERQLNKRFNKNIDKNTWNKTGIQEHSGSANLIKIGGGKFSFKNSYTNEGLKERLRELDVNADVTGEIIRVKSVKVYQINRAELNSAIGTIYTQTRVKPLGIQFIPGHLLLEPWTKDIRHNLFLDIETLKSKIPTIMVPIGGLIDYSGEIEQIRADLFCAKGMPNFILCNGATVPKGEYDASLEKFDKDPKHGYQVPKLIGKFVKTVPYKRVGIPGGKKENLITLKHKHETYPCSGATGHNALLAQQWDEYGQDCNERTARYTDIRLADQKLDNEPPFYGLMKLIRVR